MNLQYGLTNEAFKYTRGGCYFDNDTADIYNVKNIELLVCKNDWAAFQVVLKSDEKMTVAAGSNTFFPIDGPEEIIRLNVHTELKGSTIQVQHIGLVQDDDGVYKSDMLLNNEFAKVSPGTSHQVWVKVAIPQDTPARSYKGFVDIYSHKMLEGERKLGTLTFEIEVKDVVLPHPKDHKFMLGLWQHTSNIARKHETPLWSEAHFTVLENYISSLADLGGKAITVIASEIPWCGQLCYLFRDYPSDLFEYSMIKVEKDEQDNVICDFSVMDRYIDLCMKYGIDREIEIIGLLNVWSSKKHGFGSPAEDYPEEIRIRYFDQRDGTYKFLDRADDIRKYIKAIENHFIERGLIEKVKVVADEPADVEAFERRFNTIRNIAPSFKYKIAIGHAEFVTRFKDEINEYVPHLRMLSKEWDVIDSTRNEISSSFLWYVCCGPKQPNTFIMSPLVESRLIGLMTAYFKFNGFVRWNYTVWPEKPREKMSYHDWPAGDTNFVYPANDGRPILTLRYMNLKRGIEDFELIAMLREKRPDAEEILKKVWNRIFRFEDFRDFHRRLEGKPENIYSLDYEDYLEARKILLSALENS